MNLFNIHSGGGERTLEYQSSTFKVLCENAVFDQGDVLVPNNATSASSSPIIQDSSAVSSVNSAPIININLHIHLPENKTRRDYEAIIEDIGFYIFGRKDGDRSDN